MARTAASTGSKYLSISSAIITAYPFTLACWAKSANFATGNYQSLITLSDNSTVYNALYSNPTGKADVFTSNTGTAEAATSVAATNGAWSHFCGIFAGNTDRRVFLNGGNKATTATNVATPAGQNRTQIGTLWSGTNPADADIAMAGIWNVALADQDVANLAAGLSPLLVRPDALIAYWPLWGDDSPEPDWNPTGTHNSMTLVASPAKAATDSPTVPVRFSGSNRLYEGLI